MVLEKLFESNSSDAGPTDCSINIVVVPALGLSRPAGWLDASDPSSVPWLWRLVSKVASRAHVWEYVYNKVRHASLSDGLMSGGNDLLHDLFILNTSNTAEKLPLVFVCHGTGGLVLKKALCICRDQPFQYRPIIDVVAGAIFLSSPHFVGDKAETKKTISLICKSFERIALKVPVVSAYETKDTSTHRGIFAKFRSKSGRGQVVRYTSYPYLSYRDPTTCLL